MQQHMKTETFNLLVCDPITRALMRRIKKLEAERREFRRNAIGDLRTIRRDVRAIRKRVQ